MLFVVFVIDFFLQIIGFFIVFEISFIEFFVFVIGLFFDLFKVISCLWAVQFVIFVSSFQGDMFLGIEFQISFIVIFICIGGEFGWEFVFWAVFDLGVNFFVVVKYFFFDNSIFCVVFYQVLCGRVFDVSDFIFFCCSFIGGVVS